MFVCCVATETKSETKQTTFVYCVVAIATKSEASIIFNANVTRNVRS